MHNTTVSKNRQQSSLLCTIWVSNYLAYFAKLSALHFWIKLHFGRSYGKHMVYVFVSTPPQKHSTKTNSENWEFSIVKIYSFIFIVNIFRFPAKFAFYAFLTRKLVTCQMTINHNNLNGQTLRLSMFPKLTEKCA